MTTPSYRAMARERWAEYDDFVEGLDPDAFHRVLAQLHPEDPLRARHGHADCTYPGCEW